MPSLTPCPTCHSHVLVFERSCPHCGAALRSSSNPAGPLMAAVTLGLALTACRAEPDYGVPDTDTTDDVETATGTDTGDSTDTTTDTTGESEYGVPDTGEDTTTTTDSTDGEPEYGVPDTGTDTDTTGAEPDYGVPDTGTDTDTGTTGG